MGYSLGVDLGNTYVAAAVSHGADAEMATLGQGSLVIPAAVFVGEDGTITVGEPAVRRGLAHPDRLALGFKRRLGNPTPVFVGGLPYGPPQLLAELLRSVLATVTAECGGEPPERVMLARPATWDPGRRALFDQTPGLAGLPEAGMISEPEAVITHYATSRRLADGSLVAVYDLGGGTFEVSVVRKHPGGAELVGEAQGIERLGGVDFDEALIDLVDHSLGGPLSRLDPNSPNSLRAMARLREQCVYAKEVLSHDDVVDIPVQLDAGHLEARVTRDDLENLIGSHIRATVPAVRAALRSAQLSDTQLDGILLVGGSSRIPLVARILRETFRCPVRTNVNPDNAVALGAAVAAAAVHAPPASAVPAPTAPPRPAPAPRSFPSPPSAAQASPAPTPFPTPTPTPPPPPPAPPSSPPAIAPRAARPAPPTPPPLPATATPPPVAPLPVPAGRPAAPGSPTPLFVPTPPLAPTPGGQPARPAPVSQLPATSPLPLEAAAPEKQKDRQAGIEVRRFATLLALLLILTIAGAVLFVVLAGIRI